MLWGSFFVFVVVLFGVLDFRFCIRVEGGGYSSFGLKFFLFFLFVVYWRSGYLGKRNYKSGVCGSDYGYF